MEVHWGGTPSVQLTGNDPRGCSSFIFQALHALSYLRNPQSIG